jgi:hypothetical protein
MKEKRLSMWTWSVTRCCRISKRTRARSNVDEMVMTVGSWCIAWNSSWSTFIRDIQMPTPQWKIRIRPHIAVTGVDPFVVHSALI